MQRYGLRTKIYPGLSAVGWLSGVLGAIVGATAKYDPTKMPASWAGLGEVLAWSKSWSSVLVPVLAGIAALAVVARRLIGQPWVWEAIHDLLNGYRDFVFAEEMGEPLDQHRVTLFRHFHAFQYPCVLKRPWSKKLIPVERSGHLTQKSDTAFQVPDDPSRVQGIAGQVWRAFKTIMITDLPDLPADSSPEMVSQYARRTWSREDWVRQRLSTGKALGRSFCGIPIRVKGREWGVIIIDSRSAAAVQRNSEAFYDLMGRSFGKLLERI